MRFVHDGGKVYLDPEKRIFVAYDFGLQYLTGGSLRVPGVYFDGTNREVSNASAQMSVAPKS